MEFPVFFCQSTWAAVSVGEPRSSWELWDVVEDVWALGKGPQKWFEPLKESIYLFHITKDSDPSISIMDSNKKQIEVKPSH